MEDEVKKSRISWVKFTLLYLFSLMLPLFALFFTIGTGIPYMFLISIIFNVGMFLWSIIAFKDNKRVVVRWLLTLLFAGVQLIVFVNTMIDIVNVWTLR